jgi:hypothetical protein
MHLSKLGEMLLVNVALKAEETAKREISHQITICDECLTEVGKLILLLDPTEKRAGLVNDSLKLAFEVEKLFKDSPHWEHPSDEIRKLGYHRKRSIISGGNIGVGDQAGRPRPLPPSDPPPLLPQFYQELAVEILPPKSQSLAEFFYEKLGSSPRAYAEIYSTRYFSISPEKRAEFLASAPPATREDPLYKVIDHPSDLWVLAHTAKSYFEQRRAELQNLLN